MEQCKKIKLFQSYERNLKIASLVGGLNPQPMNILGTLPIDYKFPWFLNFCLGFEQFGMTVFISRLETNIFCWIDKNLEMGV